MRRLLILIFVLLVIPATFFAGVAWYHYRDRQNTSYVANSQLLGFQEIQEKIYGSNGFHYEAYNDKTRALLDAYDPATMGGGIKISYIGGLRDISESYLELQGTGELHSGVDGNRELVATIDPTRCRDIFRRTLTSGIINYSDDVIELKKDIIQGGGVFVTCGAITRIEITVEKLGVSKVIEVYMPKVEHENHPHIIEYKLVLDLEEEINGLVPAGFPLWK